MHHPTLMLCLCLCLAFSICCVVSGRGQNYTHYWSHQYGREGILLSGAVLAGTEDNTTAIYNPAGLGFTKGDGLALSFLSGGFNVLKVTNALAEGVDIKASSVFVLPKFIAYDLPILKNVPGKIVFVLFHQDFPSLNQAFRGVNILEDDPDIVRVSNFTLNKRINEIWGGFAYSYPVSEELQSGVSILVPYRMHSNDISMKIEDVASSDPTRLEGLNSVGYKYNYHLFSFKLKFGLAYKPSYLPNLSLGLTWSPPSFSSFLDNGYYEYHGLISPNEDVVSNYTVVENMQIDANANYRYPMSLGFGAQYDFESFSLYSSVEHFFKLSPYTVIDDNKDPYNGLLPNAFIPYNPLLTKSDAITNFALGCSFRVKEHLTLLGGFQTDQNFYKSPIPDTPIQMFTSGWNLYHLSVGTSTLLNRNEISIGLTYSFSFQNDIYHFGTIDPDADGIFGLLQKAHQDTNVRYNALSISFTYNFFNEIF